MDWRPIATLAAGLLIVLGGCGSDPLGRHAVSGSVTLDGAPVDNGNISFQPIEGGTTSAGGPVTAGKYSISAEGGLAVGKYRVSINAPKPGTGGQPVEGAMPGDELPLAEELIPPEWNLNSQQTIEVKSGGPYEFNFDIKTK